MHRWLASGAIAAAALAAALIMLALNAATSAPPAYALTKHADGSVTVTIHQVATAVPALNARFAQMGIDETVVPVKANCATPAPPLMSLVNPHARAYDTLTLSPGRKRLRPGYAGVLAAEQLPHGHVALAMGATKPPVPGCFSPPAYRVLKGGVKIHIPR